MAAIVKPAAGDFVIVQGDTLPLMRIPIPANSAGELLDLTGCTVTFLGRKDGTDTFPSPIIRPIESFAQETEDGADVIAVYVHFEVEDTKQPALVFPAGVPFMKMQGELEVVDAAGERLTVKTLDLEHNIFYCLWWIQDDIGDGAA